MTANSFFVRSTPFLLAIAVPLGIAACSSTPADDTGNEAGKPSTGGTTTTAGKGGSAGTGQTALGGTGGSTGGTGGTAAGTGGTGVGGAGRGGAGAGGTSPASGGMATGGASGGRGGAGAGGSSSGGAATGGIGGASQGGMGGAKGGASQGGSTGTGGTSSGGFTLTSPDQAEGAKFGTEYTCAAMNGTFGAGVNPDLIWMGAPAGTMSFAITFIDTKIGADNAMGQHWAAWDIPASAMEFPKGTMTLTGALQGGKQTNKYLAPCPSGQDTYEFKIFALSTAMLSVTGAEGTGTSNSAGVAKVLAALAAVTPLGTATLHGNTGPKGM